MKSTKWITKSLVCFFFIVFFLMPALSMAQQYPNKPVTVTVGYGPGSGMDLCVRALTSASEKYFGQPFVIVNSAGGAGSVAFSIVAKQRSDGYHLMGNSTTGLLYVP